MCSDHRTKVAGAPIAVLCLTAKNQVPFELPVFKRLKDCSGKSRLFAGIIGEKGAAKFVTGITALGEKQVLLYAVVLKPPFPLVMSILSPLGDIKKMFRLAVGLEFIVKHTESIEQELKISGATLDTVTEDLM
jgi:hypothetical protein